MDKKVSELLEAIELNDEDILMILQSGQNKKIKAINVFKNINELLSNLENAKAERSDVEYHGILINQLREKVLNLEDNTEDSGWQTASLTGDFKAYQDNSKYTPRYRKIGKVVEIEGVVSPTKTLTGSGTQVTIFTLPTDFMPSESRYAVCQGSGINRWVLQVNTNGTVTFSRYGKADYTDINAGDWLPFNITYMID